MPTGNKQCTRCYAKWLAPLKQSRAAHHAATGMAHDRPTQTCQGKLASNAAGVIRSNSNMDELNGMQAHPHLTLTIAGTSVTQPKGRASAAAFTKGRSYLPRAADQASKACEQHSPME